jgi:broad specificity phosphatase PhoE/2-polyprenyl-3-methyl-5-hydroxy-6-metoxy-1,4-benzoquinol methylase
MRIFFVLHGDTAAAGSGKLTSEDQPITSDGGSQATRAAHDLVSKLQNEGIVRILTSPRLRAQQTAAILVRELKFENKVEIDPRLAERDCSAFDGQLVKAVFARPETELVNEGMESMDSLIARSRSLITDVQAANAPGAVVVVSHSSNYLPLMLAVEHIPRNAGLELELPNRTQAVELKPQRSDQGQAANDQNVGATGHTYDKIAAEYIASNPELRPVVKGTLDKFASMLKGQTVLNVGCAGGLESGYLAGKGLEVSGCDISEEFVKSARQAYPGCTFFVADMRRLPDGQVYDGLWCNAAFLHIPKSDAFGTLKGFAKALKPGGLLYVSVMRGDFDGLRTNQVMHWGNRHFSDYEPEELQDLLQQAGFSPLDSGSKDTDWGPVFLHFFATKT